jgi:predicted transposase YbfD/YdcC
MQEIPDPRSSRKKKHDCAEILTCLVMAYMTGRTALRRAVSWITANEAQLKKYMKLKGGPASVSTISRLLSGIDEEIFTLTFSDWAFQLLNSNGRHLIIDGKGLRGAASKVRLENVPYMLNVIDAATQMVVAQMPIEEKKGEISEIPRLIDRIDVKDNTVTIDAIGTQTAIMEKLHQLGAVFLLQVKKNQPQMYEDIVSFFEKLDDEKTKIKEDSRYESPLKEYLNATDRSKVEEKNRERYEQREYISCRDPSCLTKLQEMPYIQMVGVSRQLRRLIVRDRDGEDITPDVKTFLAEGSIRQRKPENGDGITDSMQTVGLVSNKKLTAEEAGAYKRAHWKIENGLHHVLDDVFREDRSPAKGSKNNLALVRKFAYNIIRYTLAKLPGNTGVIGMMDYFNDNPDM